MQGMEVGKQKQYDWEQVRRSAISDVKKEAKRSRVSDTKDAQAATLRPEQSAPPDSGVMWMLPRRVDQHDVDVLRSDGSGSVRQRKRDIAGRHDGTTRRQ